MSLASSNTTLTPEDKLDVIRRLDPTGDWESLDTWRYCSVCKKLFSGRQIEVLGGTRNLGPFRLHCPTAECDSTPADWRSSYHAKPAEDDEFSFTFEENGAEAPVRASYRDDGR
jgi:hypothetical protein